MARTKVVFGMLLALGLAGCDSDKVSSPGDPLAESAPRSQFQVVTGSGDLTNALTEFRDLLGAQLNVTPGPLTGGHREIKWDGVPAILTNTDALPLDNFRGAGLLYSNLGTGLRVSDNDFSDIDPSYADQFNPFSGLKTFAPIGTPNSEVTFVIPGSSTPATVRGFGVVLSDVDRMGSASIKLFTADNQSLGQYQAPVRSDANGFSFIGVAFKDPIVARVVISSGQASLAPGELDVSDGGNRDLVVFDDLLYGEPQG
jgi:hypothetical protein